jgi:hypothetical protein
MQPRLEAVPENFVLDLDVAVLSPLHHQAGVTSERRAIGVRVELLDERLGRGERPLGREDQPPSDRIAVAESDGRLGVCLLRLLTRPGCVAGSRGGVNINYKTTTSSTGC